MTGGAPTRLLVVAAAATAVGGVLWGALSRVAVTGDSMRPTLEPGDRLVVLRRPRRRVGRAPTGALVVVGDPREPRRRVVKRVVARTADGLDVRGDNERASTDSRTWGTVPWALVHGTVVYRYAPAERAGRLSQAPGGGPTGNADQALRRPS